MNKTGLLFRMSKNKKMFSIYFKIEVKCFAEIGGLDLVVYQNI
jgi:hypothetical protein